MDSDDNNDSIVPDLNNNGDGPTSAIINDVIWSGSPLDQYLESLLDQGLINDDFKGEVIDFEQPSLLDELGTNQENETHSNNITHTDGEESKQKSKQIDQSPLIVVNNDIERKVVYLYNEMVSSIIGSEILHPAESPFLNVTLCIDTLPLPVLSLPLDESKISLDRSTPSQIYLTIQLLKYRLNQPNAPWLVLLFIALLCFVDWIYIFLALFTLFAIDNYNMSNKLKRIDQTIELNQSLINQLIQNINTNLDQYSKSIQLIREVELISKGYRFSSPLTPIERIETDVKSNKSLVIRSSVVSSIRTTSLLIKETIENLSSQHNNGYVKSNLSDLFNLNTDQNTTQEEHDCQLSIISIKSMYQEYQLIVSNFFTLFILLLWNKFNIQNILLNDKDKDEYQYNTNFINTNEYISKN